MRFIRVVQSTMQPSTGTLPPLKPVPEPLVTTGVPVFRRQREDRCHVFAGAHQNHRFGQLLQDRRPVIRIGDQILMLSDDGFRREAGRKF